MRVPNTNAIATIICQKTVHWPSKAAATSATGTMPTPSSTTPTITAHHPHNTKVTPNAHSHVVTPSTAEKVVMNAATEPRARLSAAKGETRTAQMNMTLTTGQMYDSALKTNSTKRESPYHVVQAVQTLSRSKWHAASSRTTVGLGGLGARSLDNGTIFGRLLKLVPKKRINGDTTAHGSALSTPPRSPVQRVCDIWWQRR